MNILLLFNLFESSVAFYMGTSHAKQNKWLVCMWHATLGRNGLNIELFKAVIWQQLIPFSFSYREKGRRDTAIHTAALPTILKRPKAYFGRMKGWEDQKYPWLVTQRLNHHVIFTSSNQPLSLQVILTWKKLTGHKLKYLLFNSKNWTKSYH